MLSIALTDGGYAVTTAENGAEALRVFRELAPAIVLTDIKMPGMDALEVLEEVRGSHPEIPMIIITGEGTVANAIKCMKKGAYDFVTKPFRADDLVAVVTRAAEQARAELARAAAGKATGRTRSIRKRLGSIESLGLL